MRYLASAILMLLATSSCSVSSDTQGDNVDQEIDDLSSQGLFEEISSPTAEMSGKVDGYAGVVRHRVVQLRKEMQPTANDLVLNLFDDVVFRVLKKKVVARSTKAFSWFGSIENMEEISHVALTVEDKVIVGHIRIGANYFEIKSIKDGTFAVIERQLVGQPDCIAPNDVEEEDESESETSVMTKSGGSYTIDVMVLYTEDAQDDAGGSSAIKAEIQAQIDQTNVIFENSGINAELRLAHTLKVTDYDESDADSIYDYRDWLDDVFTDSSTAFYKRRDEYNVDLISFWVKDGVDACGVAHIMDWERQSFAKQAVSVVDVDCHYKYTFTHELGHIFGAHHDWDVDWSLTSAHGYVNLDGEFRTMMAYDDECEDEGVDCPRIEYFSSEDGKYNGYELGGYWSDNTQRLNNTANTVASFDDYYD